MSKHKDSLQTHHLYLGAGGMLAVAALVIALTFGLSSAQTQCTTGMHWDTATMTCMPDSGSMCPTGQIQCPAVGSSPAGCYTTCPTAAPTCTAPAYLDTATNTCKTPAVACTAPAYLDTATNTCKTPTVGSCTAGQWWDAATSTCKTSTDTHTCPTGQWWDMATSTCKTSTVGSCTAGQWWDAATSTCKTSTTVQCNWTTQYTRMSDNTCQPRANCTTVGNVDYNTPECQGVRGAATTGTTTQTQQCTAPAYWDAAMGICKTPTIGSCTAGQWWDAATSTCKPSTTGSCTDRQHKMPGPPEWCMEGAIHTATQQCTAPAYWDPASQTCKTGTMTEFGMCGPGEQPTTANPCRPADGQQQAAQWTPTKTECPSSKPISCEANNYFTCVVTQLECDGYRKPAQQTQPQPGTCPQDMQQCPNAFDPSRQDCMPKRIFWDQVTQKNIEGGRDATCADFRPLHMTEVQHEFQPPFGPKPMGPRPPFEFGFGEGKERPDGGFNPCEFNPNDLFCKAGFNFGDLTKMHEFDESMFDPTQFEVRNVKQELRNLKREAKGWARDVKQARQQLKEVSRESSGFACPTAVEVDGLVGELEKAVAQVETLSEASTEEEIQRALALREHINGRYDHETGEQTPGVRSKLFGGAPDPETNEPTPGKMQSLNVCREISGTIFEVCQTYQQVSEKYENIKGSDLPAETLAVFAEVLPQLKSRCENPLDVLAKKGVSLDVLSKPWRPDPEKCSFGGGPFPGPMPFPGPHGFPGAGGGGGGPMMMPGMGNFPPEMMKMMMEKMKAMESEGEFPGGGNGSFEGMPYGRDFQSSVLMAPSHPFVDGDEDTDDEDFEDDFEGEFEDGGFMEMSDECKSPVFRYLGINDLMRKLAPVRGSLSDHFEGLNACNMIEMGKKFADKETVRGGRFGGPPPEIQELLALGSLACEEGDTELVESIKTKMIRGGRGRDGFKGFGIDPGELMREKFAEKFKLLRKGKGEDKSTANLQKKIAALQAQLSEAQKMIFALKEEVASLGAQLSATLGEEADKNTLAALATLGDNPKEEVSASKTEALSDILVTVETAKESLKEALPAKEEAKAIESIDAVVKTLVLSPPSDEILTDVKESLSTIVSYATSEAPAQEILEKVQDEAATIAVLNNADTENKVAEGVCASSDTCNLGEWYASWALKAESLGLVKEDAPTLDPAGANTVEMAVVRIANLAVTADTVPEFEKPADAKELAKLDLPDASVPEDASWWAEAQWAALAAAQPDAAAVLKTLDPNEPITREQEAALLATALDLKAPENAEQVVPADAAKSEYVDEIAASIEAGFMSTTDGTHFSPDQTLSRSQDFVIATNAAEYIASTQEGAVSGEGLHEESLDEGAADEDNLVAAKKKMGKKAMKKKVKEKKR